MRLACLLAAVGLMACGCSILTRVPEESRMGAEKHDKAMRTTETEGDGLAWHLPSEAPFRLAGFAWFEKDGVYRRMPVDPQWPLSEAVDNLANCTSGGQVQFRTNSRKVSVRVQLAAKSSMDHMPQTGAAGFDCYVGPPGQQRYVSTTRFGWGSDSYTCPMFDLPERRMRNVTLNFPLYQGVKDVQIGLEPDAKIEAPPAYADGRPIIVYGTSITQGGCASRPGMAYTNILSRHLNRPFINLGFSGSGRGEPEVARTIATIPNPGGFVLDYEANAAGGQLEATLDEFIKILREAHPDVPILVVSRIHWARDLISPTQAEDRERKRDFQRDLVERRRAGGDENLYFLDGGTLLPEDFEECTVDGAHPTDLGFWHIARRLEPVLCGLLGD
jgi:hypothetical protein